MLEETLGVVATVVEDKVVTQGDFSGVVSLPTLLTKRTLSASDKKHAVLLSPRGRLPLPLQSSVYQFLVEAYFGGAQFGVVDKSVV